MVYTGKPSKACETCRARRIKCDEGRPVCAQCIRTKRECAGYRDRSSLIFRSQNQVAEKRARGIPLRTPPPRSASSTHLPVDDREVGDRALQWRVPLKPIPQTLIPTVKERALAFFFQKYILLPPIVRRADGLPQRKGYLARLGPLYQTTASDSALERITSAVSLAAYGHAPSRKHLRGEAQSQYASAMKQLKMDLNDPEVAVQDRTFMAITLFGMYEVRSQYFNVDT